MELENVDLAEFRLRVNKYATEKNYQPIPLMRLPQYEGTVSTPGKEGPLHSVSFYREDEHKMALLVAVWKAETRTGTVYTTET